MANIDQIRSALALLNNQQAATAAWRAASLESDCSQDANAAMKIIRDRNADIQRLNEALRREEKAEVEKLLDPVTDTIVKNGITYKRQEDPKRQKCILGGVILGALVGGIMAANKKEVE